MNTNTVSADYTVKIELLSGHVMVNGTEHVLDDLQRAFVCALARCRHPAPRENVQALLWPDVLQPQADNRFSVALHRLRKRLGDTFVLQSTEGYRLGDGVVVDLWEIEDFSRGLAELEPRLTRHWLSVYRRIACGCVRSNGKYEFVSALERRLLNAARNITERLATVALKRGDAVLALECARLSLQGDPCDEAAREISIRAQLALGDRAAAIREYRDYARALADELQLEPCLKLHSLIAARATTVTSQQLSGTWPAM